jgi:hypothetical protein
MPLAVRSDPSETLEREEQVDLMDMWPDSPGPFRRFFLVGGLGFVALGSVAAVIVRQRVPDTFSDLPPVTLAGRVYTRVPGLSPRGIEVLASQPNNPLRASASITWVSRTNFAGTFFFTGTPAGPVDISLRRPRGAVWTFRTLKPVLLPRKEPLWIELIRGATVKGRIVRKGNALEDVALGLRSADRDTLAFSGKMETRTGPRGDFAFQHVGVRESFWIYAQTGGLPPDAAVRPQELRTGDDGATLDLGDIEVIPSLSVSGRLVLSSGEPVPDETVVTARPVYAWGSLRAKVDRLGRFEVRGLPPGPLSLTVDSPDGYRALIRTRGTPPGAGLSLDTGQLETSAAPQILAHLEGDIRDLTIQCDLTHSISSFNLRLP